MSIYKRFCNEAIDENGMLTAFSLKYPGDFNFGYDVLDVLAAESPDRRAVVWCDMAGESKTFSFRDISRLSNQAANVFLKNGISRGDKVMLVLKRQPEYWYILPALHKIGAVAVPVTHMLTEEDFAYRLDSGDIKAAVCVCEEAGERLLAAVTKSRRDVQLWSAGAEIAGFKGITEEINGASCILKRRPTAADEPILMYFTSGTTGYPKAVMHDHRYPLAHIITAKYWQQVEDGGLHFTVAETGWAKAAWGKLYGQWLCGSAVMVYDFDNFDPRQLTVIINRFGVNTFCAPPTVFRYLVKKEIGRMPSLHHVCTAGEALSEDVFVKFQEMTGLELTEGYGQTETTLITANFKGMKSCPGSLGKASPLYHVELLKGDGTFAGDGELGEIVIVPKETGLDELGNRESQIGIFTGYFENAQLYDHVWRGGVYHTGDIAGRDAEGYFRFHGRADDVIKSGGYRVGPYEVENVLMKHPAVLECSVVGIADELRGQAVKAFVVLSAGYAPKAALKRELKEFCNKRLAEYKWIRQLEFTDEMPKTISGKIRRVELRQAQGK